MAEIIASGNGWTLYDNGLLDIYIVGSMPNYSNYGNTPPWFNYETQIASVTIGDSVKSIGNYAFYNCSNLSSAMIGNKVKSIGTFAFGYCYDLASVAIPDGVTSIADNAFRDCRSVSNMAIPDSVTSIGSYAFSGCYGLVSVTIGDGVTSIGEAAFNDCWKLTDINVKAGNANYLSDNGVLFNKDKSVLIRYPQKKSLTAYAIPDSVTSIGSNAFRSCSNLASVTIPDSVTSIGSNAFSYCQFESLTIPDSVTYIASYAFDHCGFASVTISNGVTSIWNFAFAYCPNLVSVTIPDSVTIIGQYAFVDCSNLVSVTIPDSVTSVYYHAFRGCDSLTDVYYAGLPSQWEEIAIDAYNDPLLNANIHFTEPPPEPVQTVSFGLKNVHYAVMTEHQDETVSYAEPVAIPGAVSLSLNPAELRKSLAADNVDYWTADVLNRYDGDLNIALIPDSFRADCLGELTDADSGVKYETSKPVMGRFALLFEFDGDAHKRRHIFYNCSASKPAVASQTVNPDDGPDPAAESLAIAARPLKNTLFKARAKPDAAPYDDWFSSIFFPSEFTSNSE